MSFNTSVGKADEASKFFNDYHEKWKRDFTETNETAEINAGGVIYRLFGSDTDKQARWDKLWRKDYPDWAPVQSSSVSSDPKEIWGDMRMVKKYKGNTETGWLVPNTFIIGGHEGLHTLRQYDKRFLDPDLLTDPRTYE